jgi:hypothetical protein
LNATVRLDEAREIETNNPMKKVVKVFMESPPCATYHTS